MLKNFSALKAIISALQSHAVFRLKRVWHCVTRWICRPVVADVVDLVVVDIVFMLDLIT